MAYPYAFKNRIHRDEVYCYEGSDTFGAAADTYTFDINIPFGAWLCGISVWANGFDENATITAQPFADKGQTTLGNKLDFGYGNASGQTVTLAATSGTVGQVMTLNAGDFSSNGISAFNFGLRMTVNCSATSGTFHYALSAQPA